MKYEKYIATLEDIITTSKNYFTKNNRVKNAGQNILLRRFLHI